VVKDFLRSIPHNFKEEDARLLRKAFEFSQKAHEGQKRKSGEEYFSHCKAVTTILGQIFPNVPTLVAALMHDIPEDTKITNEEIKKEFDEEIAKLVDGVTKLGQVRFHDSTDKFYVENLRKLFIATSEDIRVILIKLADRIHNMRTIEYLPKEKQIKIAKETLEMYAPIAGRLGISSWKDELEDLSFKVVYPKEYEETKKVLNEEIKKRDQNIKEMKRLMESTLRNEGVKFLEISGRIKRIYSLYKKLQKYKGDISKIFDIFALRIIVKSTADCYSVLGIIHRHFQPMPGRIKDYFSTPKPNGYQSIHTTVFDPKGQIFEMQIRTDLMHEEADRGIAAHWFYSEEGKGSSAASFRAPWVKELRAWQEDTLSPEEFLDSLKIDFFQDRIFVFTPKGDIKDLPMGATTIDFAFAVHTDLGYHMMGAKINGKMASIYDELNKGDVIEIIKNKQPVKISRDWLEHAQTSNARNRIRHYLHENDKGIYQRIKELKLSDLKPSLPTFFRKK
jgi:GTP pyrophosphokinase